jgi:hypothetical protein
MQRKSSLFIASNVGAALLLGIPERTAIPSRKEIFEHGLTSHR